MRTHPIGRLQRRFLLLRRPKRHGLQHLILSRSSYFRNMLQGPWKEANAPIVTLNVDHNNVNSEAMAIALVYLYGHHPKLNDNNAFRVLAAASFLDLQDLCAICTEIIISELWTSNFLAYQVFAESRLWDTWGKGEECLLGLSLSKWCHGIERGVT
ncbi:hypothetical protein HRI_001679900 [Hibiscus trionum]|uniref:BTB domain-containing protein n=1 Tax=Hibiscus trionum TaxID=183268 RepID=A0A9W7LXT8_HIBTR|nr:hypothetical protein HRI_001679900 [Hibiscus trionum]